MTDYSPILAVMGAVFVAVGFGRLIYEMLRDIEAGR
jgi:uncharacterized membrane protein